jgi:hypothetical protein
VGGFIRRHIDDRLSMFINALTANTAIRVLIQG